MTQMLLLSVKLLSPTFWVGFFMFNKGRKDLMEELFYLLCLGILITCIFEIISKSWYWIRSVCITPIWECHPSCQFSLEEQIENKYLRLEKWAMVKIHKKNSFMSFISRYLHVLVSIYCGIETKTVDQPLFYKMYCV